MSNKCASYVEGCEEWAGCPCVYYKLEGTEMSKTVEKKIFPLHFKDVMSGRKNFELRKDEDGIQPNDLLVLKEYDGEKYTGSYVSKRVTYVLRDCPQYGLMQGYCIIGLGETFDYD